jgi:hypothetical protein
MPSVVSAAADPVLELPFDAQPDPDEFLRAAMRWHFSPETGSPFWLEQAKTLDFDPIADVRTFARLNLFPNVANALRLARAEDLIPRGYGPEPDVFGVYESGGTTGAPKRVVLLREWLDVLLAWSNAELDGRGVPRDMNWLCAIPSGPHMVGDIIAAQATTRNGFSFHVDFDPRWVKKLISEGKPAEAGTYAEHLVDQLSYLLQTQDVGVLMITPPVLERLACRDDLVKLVNDKVKTIYWVGTQMDPDTRHLYRTALFPDIVLYGGLGSTMILGNASERHGLTDDDPCIYDPFSPYMTFSVIEPDTAQPVPYGERGQVVMNHVSKSVLLPNNLERDYATRIQSPGGRTGDSVADVAPMPQFDNETVVEGVY